MNENRAHCKKCGQEIGAGRTWWIRLEKEIRPAAWCKKAITQEEKIGPLCYEHANEIWQKICGEKDLPLAELRR